MKHDTKPQSPVNRPRAVAAGTIFGNVDCYVLEDGSTVLSQRGMLRGLRGKTPEEGGAEDGDLGRYLARLPEKYSGLAAAPFSFVCPDGSVAVGRPSHDFVAMCRAYAEMLTSGSIHKARLPMARNAVAILSKLAERGIDEIVYEAANYRRPSPVAIVQAPAFDAASVGDLVRTIVMESMRVIANEVRGDIAAFRGAAMASSGTITGMQADDIRRAVVYCALAKATLGDRNFGSARKSFNNMLAGAIGWGGTARQLHLMPASKYPDAMALMRAIRTDLDHRLRAKGLPLPVVGGRQTEMFPIKDGAGQVKPSLALVANNNRKKGAA